MLPTGRRDRLVTLVEQVHSVSPSYTPIMTDGDSFQMFAAKDDVSGLEQITSNQTTAPFTTRWEMGFNEAINPETVDVPKLFVLEYAGKRFNIQSATMIGRREGIELTTLARQG